MNPAKILYIDGHGVSVTRFTLKIKNQTFPIKTLSYRPVLVPPKRFLATMTFIIGLILLTSGYVKAMAPDELAGYDAKILLPFLAMYAGMVIIGLSIMTAFMSRERYALQITTSEGVRNVLVSRKKSYIIKIVHRLHFAASLHHQNTSQEHTLEMQQVA